MLMQATDQAPICLAPELVLKLLEEIGRHRALADHETDIIEAIVSRSGPKGQRRWMPRDERQLVALVRKRVRVPEIAVKMQRTERAVWRKLTLMRKAGKVGYFSPAGGTGRYPRKSSIASDAVERVG